MNYYGKKEGNIFRRNCFILFYNINSNKETKNEDEDFFMKKNK